MRLEKLVQVLSLEFQVDEISIEKTFDHFHSCYSNELSYWSTGATRKKLTIHFWLRHVGSHLTILLFLGAIAGFCLSPDFSSSSLIGKFLVLPIIFVILFLSFYWPMYQLDFLPKLNSYADHYAGKQLEGIQKCKKEQYSVLSLMLIQFAIHKVAGISTPSLSAEENSTLVNLYGVSNKMIESSLKTIIQNSWDRKRERKRTEIQEAFAEAHEYFNVFKSKKAILHLKELEQKLFS